MKYSIVFTTATFVILPAFASVLPRQVPPQLPVNSPVNAAAPQAPRPPSVNVPHRREALFGDDAHSPEEADVYGFPIAHYHGDETGRDQGHHDLKVTNPPFPGLGKGKDTLPTRPEVFLPPVTGVVLTAPLPDMSLPFCGFINAIDDAARRERVDGYGPCFSSKNPGPGDSQLRASSNNALNHEYQNEPLGRKEEVKSQVLESRPVYKRDFLDVKKLNSRGGPTDVDILNFALTLEHLEAAFYRQGLANYSKGAFVAAGYPEWVRSRFEQIAAHEATHVEFLTSAITAAGARPVEPCEYQFPDTDVNSFIDTAFVFESVGVSAYNGAAAFIDNKAYLTVAASILGVEARHSGWINSAVKKSAAWNTAFETPLDMNQVISLVSGFIKSSPASNPPLPAQAPPPLAVHRSADGKIAQLEFDSKGEKQLFAALISGTGTTFIPIKHGKNGKAEIAIPKDLKGVVYVAVTNKEEVTDETTVAGLAILISFYASGDKH